jgi:hypothetical protein
VRSVKGALEVKTGILTQGASYRFRARNWSSAVPSEWTDYETSLVQDPTPPAALTSFTAQGGNGHAVWNFGVPQDPHLHHINVYRVPTGVTLDKNVHAKIQVNITGPTFSFVDGDNTAAVANTLSNPEFTTAAPPPTLGTGWTAPGTGLASHSATSGGAIVWTGQGIVAGGVYRSATVITAISGASASLTPRYSGTVNENWTTAYTTTGTKLQRYTAVSANTSYGLLANTNAVIDVDLAIHFRETALCSPQGFWDYYAFPANGSDVEGTGATPVTNVRVV